MKKGIQKIIIVLTGGVGTLAADLISKMWATGESFKEVTIIKNFFYLTRPHFNDGIAFGVDMPNKLQIIASIAIILLLGHMTYQQIIRHPKETFIKPLLFGIIVGGALGNLWERVINGHVVDFIVLKPIPTFNIADIAITLGLIALMLLFLKNKNTH